LSARRIQADYDVLSAIAQRFDRCGELTDDLYWRTLEKVQILRNGDWIGQGAEHFFEEMQNLVFPRMLRLVDALETAKANTLKISRLLHDAELEAARLFQGASAGAGFGGGTGKGGKPLPDSPLDDEAEAVEAQAIKDRLATYGVTFTGDWSVEELQIVEAAITQAGQRLEGLAVSRFGPPVPSGAELFKMFFLQDGKITFARGDADAHTSGAWAWNETTKITFYNNAFFAKTSNLNSSLLSPSFPTNFTTEFLILHELGHNFDKLMKGTNWRNGKVADLNDFLKDANKPLKTMIQDNLNVQITSTAPAMGSAGFRYAARSDLNFEEFSADAVANWVLGSYTDDDYGKFRKGEMDQIMRGVLAYEAGWPTGPRAF